MTVVRHSFSVLALAFLALSLLCSACSWSISSQQKSTSNRNRDFRPLDEERRRTPADARPPQTSRREFRPLDEERRRTPTTFRPLSEERRSVPKSSSSSSGYGASSYPTLGQELRDLEAARRDGALTNSEYEAAKQRLLEGAGIRGRR